MNMPLDTAQATEPALRYACTTCGKCCHGLRLPLSVAEGITWLQRGGRVELLCDAAPAMAFPTGSAEAYRAERAVPAISNALPVTVSVILTAVFDGPCPNLKPDMLCGAYEVRPNACRIYPAEVRPDRSINPEEKLCPPDAWGAPQPVFHDPVLGITDTVTATAVTGARQAGLEDVTRKARLLALLEIDQVALANEGYAIWKPQSDRLLHALQAVSTEAADTAMAQDAAPLVQIISPREETRRMIAEAEGAEALPDPARGYEYLPLYA